MHIRWNRYALGGYAEKLQYNSSNHKYVVDQATRLHNYTVD